MLFFEDQEILDELEISDITQQNFLDRVHLHFFSLLQAVPNDCVELYLSIENVNTEINVPVCSFLKERKQKLSF